MSVVCPKCGAPYPNSAAVIGNRSIECDHCRWAGESKDLINVEGEVKDPRAFDELRRWFAAEMGSPFALFLHEYGTLPEKDLVAFFQRAARTYLAGLLEGVLEPACLDNLTPVYNTAALAFTKSITPEVLQKMVQLGIFQRVNDADNLRFIGSVSVHGFRKLWEFLHEQEEAN